MALAAPAPSLAALAAAGTAALLLPVVFVAAGIGALSHTQQSSQPNENANADIPATYLTLYQHAAEYVHHDLTCPALDWSVLAGIGKVETNHGRSPLPGVHNGANSAGAEGPMQFLPDTFARYDTPVPPGGATPPSPYDPADAVYAASRYLCASGANRGDIHASIWAYNHADWYVTEVLDWAHRYANTAATTSLSCDTNSSVSSDVDRSAVIALRFSCAQLGKPYVWGGTGNPGYDCSGLTQAAYNAAGIHLPRTAQQQYDTGPTVTGPLHPGDLVFFGTSPTAITHVGIALTATTMIDAPDTGQTIRIDHIGRPIGATRPSTGPRP